MKFVEEISPTGAHVFGSAVVDAAPDGVAIAIAVSRTQLDAPKAFAEARSAAAAVLSFIKDQRIEEFGSSRITLSQEFRHVDGRNKFEGFTARIGYSVKLFDLDRIEDLLSGLIAAGANELRSVIFESSKMTELRADARKQAIAAARERAELCCRETGRTLGKLVAIEDANPDTLSNTGERTFHTGGVAAAGAGAKAIDPAKISVGVSLYLTYEIGG